MEGVNRFVGALMEIIHVHVILDIYSDRISMIVIVRIFM